MLTGWLRARRKTASVARQNLIAARTELADARQHYTDAITEDGEPLGPFLTAHARLHAAHEAAAHAAQDLSRLQRLGLDRQHANRTRQWCRDLYAASRDDAADEA